MNEILIIYRGPATDPNRDDVVACLLQQAALKGLTPQWLRPSPPRFDILEGEVRMNADTRDLFVFTTFISEHIFIFL